MTALLLALLFGSLIGLSLGVLGGGGSILTVPILVYILGQDAHEATVTSLVIVGTTSLFGMIPHAREGRVRSATALMFGATGLVGAFAGTALNQRVSGSMLLLLFGALMLLVAARMLRRGQGRPADAMGQPQPRQTPMWQVVGAGITVGALTGFFGVGGGFLIVPALVMVLGFPMRVAVGTSLAIIAINSAISVIARGDIASIDVQVALLFILGGIAGSLVGGRLAGRIDERRLSQGFATMVAVLGVFLIAQNAFTMVM